MDDIRTELEKMWQRAEREMASDGRVDLETMARIVKLEIMIRRNSK